MDNLEQLRLMKEELDSNKRKYDAGQETMPDAVYDEKMRAYEKLHLDVHGFIPDRKVGFITDGLGRVKHVRPMLSLRDIFSKKDLFTWLTNCKKKITDRPVKFMVEWKNDGLALSLHYEKGVLVHVLLRGDGEYGEDVTESFKRVVVNPPKPKDFTGEIRGEGVILKETYKEYHESKGLKEPSYSTERHMAAGVIRNRNSKPNLMTFKPYDLFGSVENQNDKALYLEEVSNEPVLLAFFQFDGTMSFEDWEANSEVSKFVTRCQDGRPSDWLTDGLAFKVVLKEDQERLGMAASWPQWAVAYKFPAEGDWTFLRDVKWQLGRTGVHTPVAMLDPVKIGGVVIESPTLHNFDEIKRLGLKIGSKVFIERRGDVIPKVMYAEGGTGEITLPTHCVECDSPLNEVNNEGELHAAYCVNHDCHGIKTQEAIYALNDDGFNIKGLGVAAIQKLVVSGRLDDITDIFTLSRRDLIDFAEMAESNADKVLTQISKLKEGLPLERLVAARGMFGIGRIRSKEIAKAYVLKEELPPHIGHVILADIKTVEEYGVVVVNPSATKTVDHCCITGTLKKPRKEVEKFLSDNGWGLQDSVTKKTKVLIVGEDPSESKMKAAEKNSIKILTLDEFLSEQKLELE